MENLKNKINARDMGIFVFIGGFTLGILISSLVSFSIYFDFAFILTGMCLLVHEKVFNKNISISTVLVSAFLIAFSLGSIRFQIKDSRNINLEIENEIGRKVMIEGVVTEEVERKDNSTRIIVTPLGSEEKILVSTDLYSHAEYGDRVKVTGKLQKPGIIEGEDGRDFNYGKYLSKDDIYYTISFAKTEIVSKNNGNFIQSNLYKIKNKFIEKIRVIFPEPEASLMAGLILAGKDTLPTKILDEFRSAGIVHIVVLSGYNITIISLFFLKIFSSLSLKVAGISSILGIILFTLMTGASATVIRAAVMAIIFLISKFIRRDYSAGRALIVAAFLMLIENPKILILDPSFKLSFLATLALIYASPVVDKFLVKVSERGGLKSVLSTSIATQIVVLPYLLYSTGNFSIVSLFANVLILFFIPITMLMGFVSTLVSFVSTILAIPFAYVTNLFLRWILFVAQWLGDLAFSSFHIKAFSIWIVLAWYLMYFFIWKNYQRFPQNKSQIKY